MVGNTTVYEYSFSDGVYILKLRNDRMLIGFLKMTKR